MIFLPLHRRKLTRQRPVGKRKFFMSTPNTNIEPASYAVNADGVATIGTIPVTELAKTYGTPLYVLDHETLAGMAQAYQEALKAYPGDHLVLYAAKANCSMGVCQVMTQLGLGLDLVSGGEVYTAEKAGVDLSRVNFNGNNKSADELLYAMSKGLGFISVDNAYELDQLLALTMQHEKKARILLRVTPGIECHTHEYIKTGHIDSKFGLDMSQLAGVLPLLLNQDRVTLAGLHAHIGSQIFELDPYKDLVDLLINTYVFIRETYDVTLTHINIGGGAGIKYTEEDKPLPVSYLVNHIVEALVAACDRHNFPYPTLLLEPGRSMIATAGVTLYEVGSFKTIPDLDKTYVAVDGGMGDNIRPALYQSAYSALIANKANEPCLKTVTLAGRYCESGDVLFPELKVPESIASGDTAIVFGTGAYNYSMASNYNRVGRPAVVLVHNQKAQVLVERENWDDILLKDKFFKP